MNPIHPPCRLLPIAGWLTALLPLGLAWGNGAAETIAGLVVITFILHTIMQHEWHWLQQSWVKLLLLLWAYGMVRAVFAEHTESALLNALGWLRFILLAVALQSWILVEPRWQQRMLNVGLLCIAWLSGDAIYQYLHGTDILGKHQWLPNRLTASYNKPIVGIMLAWQFLPYTLGDFSRGKAWRALLLAGLALVAIVLSGERMALLFSLMSIMGLILVTPGLRKLGIMVILSFVLAVGGLMAAKPSVYDRQVISTLKIIRNLPDSPYGVIWHSALQIVNDYPVFGIGMGNFRYVCPDTRYGADDAKHLGYSRCATHPHNIYLEWLVEGGVIALLGFIAAMAVALHSLWRNVVLQRNDYLFMALSVTFAVRLWPMASSTDFFHGWFAIPFWITLGWAMARRQEHT